jgi:poly(A) polymerase
MEGAEVAARVLTRLRFSGRAVELMRGMVRHHLRPSQMAEKGELPSPRAIYRFHRELGDAAIDTLYLNLGDYLAARGPDLDRRDWEEHCRVIGHILREGLAPKAEARAPSLIDGHVIMDRFSLPPGPAIGRLVELVREAQGSGEISTSDEAIQLVESVLSSGGSGA